MKVEEIFRRNVVEAAWDGEYKKHGFLLGDYATADEVIWTANNYNYAKQIINEQLAEEFEVAFIEYEKLYEEDERQYYMLSVELKTKGEWTDADYDKEEEAKNKLRLFAEKVEAKENERLYNEFKELAEYGGFYEDDEDDEHFVIKDIPNEVRAWVRDDDYQARQILDDAVPTEKGFQVIGWKWEEDEWDSDKWTLTAELEY